MTPSNKQKMFGSIEEREKKRKTDEKWRIKKKKKKYGKCCPRE
jgi:hypothetical protein